MYNYQQEVSAADYCLLRQAVGWEPLPQAQAQAGLEQSFLRISCHNEQGIVGCARLLWDRGYIAYVADVMVLPAHQGQGVGKHMVDWLLHTLQAHIPTGWRVKTVLLAAKGKEAFYQKQGFISRPNNDLGPGMELWLEGK